MVQRRSIIPIIWCISFLNTSACENMWNWPLKYFPKCFVENILPIFNMFLLIFNNVWLKFGLFWGFKEKSMLSMRMLIKAINRVDRVSEAIYKNSQVEINKVFKQNFDHYGELKENIWPMICTYRRVIYFLKTWKFIAAWSPFNVLNLHLPIR